MYQFILVVHILVAVVLIGLILMQCGKGAGIGASFGSGASNTVFGSQGTGSFLFKFTGILALIFFATSLILSYLVSMQSKNAALQSIPQEAGVPVNKIQMPIEKTHKIPAKN